MFSQKHATGKSLCIWFEPKMKLWDYLFIVIIITTVLLCFLATVSATSKGTDLNNPLVCLNVQIKQYPNNFYRHHYQSVYKIANFCFRLVNNAKE